MARRPRRMNQISVGSFRGQVSGVRFSLRAAANRKTRIVVITKIIKAMTCVVEPSMLAKMVNVPSHEVKPDKARVLRNSFIKATGDKVELESRSMP